MVHLEDAAIALGAVMAPVGLGLVAPLADTHTTVSLALDGGLHAHEGLIVRLAGACLLVWLSRWGDERSLSRLQVFEILMNNLSRLFLTLLNQLICELLTLVAALFRLLRVV